MKRLCFLGWFCVVQFLMVGQSIAIEMKTLVPDAHRDSSPGSIYRYSNNVKIFTSNEVDKNLGSLYGFAKKKVMSGLEVANDFVLELLTLRYLPGFEPSDDVYFGEFNSYVLENEDYRKKYIIPYITSYFNDKLVKYGEDFRKADDDFSKRTIVCPYIRLKDYSVENDTMKISYSFQAIRQREDGPSFYFYHKINKEVLVNFDLLYMQGKWFISDFKELGKFHLKVIFIDKPRPDKNSEVLTGVQNHNSFQETVKALQECRKLS